MSGTFLYLNDKLKEETQRPENRFTVQLLNSMSRRNYPFSYDKYQPCIKDFDH